MVQDSFSNASETFKHCKMNLFKKDPVKKLNREYMKLMEEAMHIQRSGDLKAYAVKIEEAEKIAKKISDLKGS